jgi:hypothetical protein
LSTGQQFLEKLVLNMTEALGRTSWYYYAFAVRRCGRFSHTVVAVIDGKVVSNFDIPMSGTPCENLNVEKRLAG